MHRYLKALGLALLAAFALSAVAASGASATPATFSFDSETGHLEGTGDVQEFIVLDSEEEPVKLTCPHVEIETETSTFEEESVTEITAGANYNDPEDWVCEAAGLASKVFFTGCHYNFKAQTNDKAHATAAIVCPNPEEEQVHIKVTLFTAIFECVTVPDQSIGGKAGKESGIHYKNINTPEEKTHVELEATIEKEIKYTLTSVCGNHTTEKGTYKGSIPVTAEDTLGVTENASYTPATE